MLTGQRKKKKEKKNHGSVYRVAVQLKSGWCGGGHSKSNEIEGRPFQ